MATQEGSRRETPVPAGNVAEYCSGPKGGMPYAPACRTRSPPDSIEKSLLSMTPGAHIMIKFITM